MAGEGLTQATDVRDVAPGGQPSRQALPLGVLVRDAVASVHYQHAVKINSNGVMDTRMRW